MRITVPAPNWTRGYRRAYLRGDLIAGVTVTAYLVPQVMAYAELAGLPAASGLWAATAGLVCYGLLGTSHQLSVGPESTTALMTAATLGSVPAAAADPGVFAAALALIVAVLCVIGWAARLSNLAELLSHPVLVGYLTGIAAIMIVSQLGKLTGLGLVNAGAVDQVADVVRNTEAVHLPTLLLGLGTLVAMLAGSVWFPHAPVALLGMLAATGVVAVFGLDAEGVRLVGQISTGVPVPELPHVPLADLKALLAPALGVAFVGYTDNILTARAFAGRHGDRIDPKRELLALGAANLGAGLVHGMPVSSSGSRTAIGDAVGAKSQLSGLVTAACTVVAVLTMRPVLAAFPVAALGAVVVYAAVRLVDVREFVRLARFRRSELVLALATTVGVLMAGVLNGILIAIGLSVLDLLRRVARPHDAVEGYVPGVAGMHDIEDYPNAEVVPGLMVYRYDSPLFFANAEDFRSRALAAVDAASTRVEWFLLNTEAMVEVDITAANALDALHRELTARGTILALARTKQDLRAALASTGLLGRIGEDRIFPTLPTAVAAFHQWRASR